MSAETEQQQLKFAFLALLEKIELLRVLYPTAWKKAVSTNTDLYLICAEFRAKIHHIDNELIIAALYKHATALHESLGHLTQ